MTVVRLNHSNAGAHLYRQRVYIYAIVEKCKFCVVVFEAIKRSVLSSVRAYKQTGINYQSLKRLSWIFADKTFRQSKHLKTDFGFDKFFKTHVNNVRAPNLNGNCIAWIHLIAFGFAL